MASHPAAQGEAEERRQIRGGRMTGRHSWRVARSGCLPLPQNVILKTSVINTCLQTVRIDRRGTLMKHVWPLWHHNGMSSKASKRRNLAALLWGFYWADTQSLLHWNLCGVSFASYWKRDSTGHLSVVTRECCSTQEWWWGSQVLLLFVVFHFLSGEPTKHLILSSDKRNGTKSKQTKLTFSFYSWNVWKRPVSRSSAVPWNVVSKAKIAKEKKNSNRIARMSFF